MIKKMYLVLILCAVFTVGCSGNTVSDTEADEKGILSKDDAEALVYEDLNEDEKEKYTIDYMKEEGTTYYIRVYENVDGEIKVKTKYTVDYNTKEIKEITD